MKTSVKQAVTERLVGNQFPHKSGGDVLITSLSWYAEKCLYHGRRDGVPHVGAIESIIPADLVSTLSEPDKEYVLRQWGKGPLTVPEQMAIDRANYSPNV